MTPDATDEAREARIHDIRMLRLAQTYEDAFERLVADASRRHVEDEAVRAALAGLTDPSAAHAPRVAEHLARLSRELGPADRAGMERAALLDVLDVARAAREFYLRTVDAVHDKEALALFRRFAHEESEHVRIAEEALALADRRRGRAPGHEAPHARHAQAHLHHGETRAASGAPAWPARTLDAEHDAIRHLLHALSGMAARVDAGGALPRRDVDEAIDALRGFADRCHHAKEERVLFPALARAAPEKAARLVRGLEGDHMAGRRLMGLMEARAAGATGEDPAEARPFAHAARLYVTLLARHIDNESRDLLPLLDAAFPPEEQARLAEELERVEREEAGAGAHERYESIIHRLGETYARAG